MTALIVVDRLPRNDDLEQGILVRLPPVRSCALITRCVGYTAKNENPDWPGAISRRRVALRKE